jgi:hypothetical protein
VSVNGFLSALLYFPEAEDAGDSYDSPKGSSDGKEDDEYPLTKTSSVKTGRILVPKVTLDVSRAK